MATCRGVLLVGVAMVIGGCSTVSETWNDWFGEPTPVPTPTPAADAHRADVFYAAVDGLALHALPSGSSQIVARLTQYQRVTRTGLARGYANVTTDAGLQGWVDNAQLLWRLPGAPAPATTETAPSEPIPTGTPVA